MKKISVIAAHEFLELISSKSYLLSIVTVPLIVALGLVVLQAKTSTDVSATSTGRVGVVDHAGLLDLNRLKAQPSTEMASKSDGLLDNTVTAIEQYSTFEAGLEDVKSARLDVLYVVGSSYLTDGEIEVYGQKTSNLRGKEPTGYSTLLLSLRAGLIRNLLPPQSAQDPPTEPALRLVNPPKLNKLTISGDGEISPMRDPWERISAVLAPLSVAFLLGFSLFLSSGALMEATAEENKNRVMELILSSVNMYQLVWGKILGLSAAGLAQVLLYLTLIFLSAIYLWTGVQVSLSVLAGCFVFWMLGHLLYAGLLVATGVLVGGQRENHQFSAVWLFTAMLPLLLADSLIGAPNGLLARILSLIPFTSPITMAFRLSSTVVPVIDIVASVTILIASIFIVVRLAAKIVRTGSLMYGKRFALAEIGRWLGEA
jgi:ABC-2 type transport system permease protein